MNLQGKKYSIRAIKEIGELSSDGVVVYDLEARKLTYINRAFARMIGKRKSVLIGDSYQVIKEALKEDDDFLSDKFQELTTQRKIANVELRLGGKNDRYVSCDAYMLRDGNTVVAIVKDISDVKEHVNYIVEYGARKDTILDMVAHNLSGPLNVTTNLLDLVDQVSQAYKVNQLHSYSRLIRENTLQCIEIINSFLKEEHLVSERVFVQSRRFDALSKIRIVVKNIQQFASEKYINISSNVEELFVTSDDVKFFQIVHNVLSNATKFTPDRGKIDVKVKDSDTSFTVTITDNGIGIPEHLHPYLFQRNTPAGRTGLKGEKSIGMGLYIVKKLVDLLKGELTFTSTEGKGSTFSITLPKS